MKYYIYIFTLFCLVSCKSEQKVPTPEKEPDTIKHMPDDMALYEKYGDSTYIPGTPIEAVMAHEILNDKDSFVTELKGKIIEVCREAGCWCEVLTEKNKTLHIKTGGNFFLDTTALGKEAFFAGYLYRQTPEDKHSKELGELTYWATSAWVHK
ncbi:MAG: DUF4920 domain-containing protein [Bacteroidota bacterium]|nr:DUF4920 domain-containing protein [Bacteroidota bacterium]